MSLRPGDHPAADVLRVLADSRSTGALELRGTPGGTIYLQDGHVTYAEAPGTPPLPGAEGDAQASAALGAAAREAVVEGGLIMLTAPPATADRPLFRSGRRHWSGAACRLRVDDVLAAVGGRARHLAGLGVEPDCGVRLVARRRTEPVLLDAAHWAVLARLDGVESPRMLAWRANAPLSGTVQAVADLVRDGLVEVVAVRAPARPDELHPVP